MYNSFHKAAVKYHSFVQLSKISLLLWYPIFPSPVWGFIFLLDRSNFLHRLIGKFRRCEALFLVLDRRYSVWGEIPYTIHIAVGIKTTHSPCLLRASVHASHDISMIEGRDWPPHPSFTSKSWFIAVCWLAWNGAIDTEEQQSYKRAVGPQLTTKELLQSFRKL